MQVMAAPIYPAGNLKMAYKKIKNKFCCSELLATHVKTVPV